MAEITVGFKKNARELRLQPHITNYTPTIVGIDLNTLHRRRSHYSQCRGHRFDCDNGCTAVATTTVSAVIVSTVEEEEEERCAAVEKKIPFEKLFYNFNIFIF